MYSFSVHSCNACAGDHWRFAVENNATSQKLPYDFRSLMHFRRDAFARKKGLTTIFPRNRSINPGMLGKGGSGTELDFLHVNLLYCGGKLCWMLNHVIEKPRLRLGFLSRFLNLANKRARFVLYLNECK